MKTAELTGAALDWAVAKCEGVDCQHGLTDDERYSTNWSQGGPIIEREYIQLTGAAQGWTAEHWMFDDPACTGRHVAEGPTPLIAAMRCYVMSQLGDEVEIPEELL